MTEQLILTSNAYYPSIGGIENSLRHLALESVGKGVDTTIVVSDIGLSPPLKKIQRGKIDGISVIRYPLRPICLPVLSWLNLLVSCFLCWRIYRELRVKMPDAVVVARFHFNALLANWAGFEAVRYLVPSVVKKQSAGEIANSGLVQRLAGQCKIYLHTVIQKAVLRRCRNFVFSETMRLQCIDLAKNCVDDYRLVKPGVSKVRFYPLPAEQRNLLRAKLGYSANDKVLLFVGRFVKAKGVNLVLEALHLLNNSAIKLLLVGEGKEREAYLALIESLGLQAQVTFVPPTSQVEQYYQLADLFVMSSNYEPLGQTLLEAFASGLRVVAFKRSANVDTATQELGMDEFVSYALEYSKNSLKTAVLNALSGCATPAVVHESAIANFTWDKLLKDMMK